MTSTVAISIRRNDLYSCRKLRLVTSLEQVLKQFHKNTNGSIVVEMALVFPILIGAFLLTSAYAQKVFQHQKLQSSIYAGASHLQDAISAGDYSSLQRAKNEDGEEKESSLIKTTKLVIKDASGMPLKLEDIDVDARCACPSILPEESGTTPEEDPFEKDVDFYKVTSSALLGNNICPAKCPDSFDARIIADITVSYTERDLLGKTVTLTEKLVTRLR